MNSEHVARLAAGLALALCLCAGGGGGNLSFRREAVNVGPEMKLEVVLPPRGGFVLTFDER